MRLAWFTPWPPQPSGIAGCSAEVTRLLATRGIGIDICVDERRLGRLERLDDNPVAPGVVRVQSAHDFVWRHARGQYDLVVYQVGNSRHHDYMWAYLFRWPGLVVLHDARLHHARARRLQTPAGAAAYRAEFAFDHPDVSTDAAELAVYGFDGRYYSLWPMTRAVVESARSVVVHTLGGQRDLADTYPERRIVYLPLGLGRDTAVSDDTRREIRRTHGASTDDVVFGVFGGLSADKRVPEIIRAFAAVRRRFANARLWLAGGLDHHLDVPALISAHGLDDAVTTLGVLDDAEFERAIASIDVSLNLRWPTAVETSGPWLQALAASRPTITVELAHQAHVPALDPRDWRSRNPADARAPVTVAIDILDEHHSLVLAMERLAADTKLRDQLGRAGHRYWLAEHTPERMADAYVRLVADAAARPIPDVCLPESLRPDIWRSTRDIAASIGIDRCELL